MPKISKQRKRVLDCLASGFGDPIRVKVKFDLFINAILVRRTMEPKTLRLKDSNFFSVSDSTQSEANLLFQYLTQRTLSTKFDTKHFIALLQTLTTIVV